MNATIVLWRLSNTEHLALVGASDINWYWVACSMGNNKPASRGDCCDKCDRNKNCDDNTRGLRLCEYNVDIGRMPSSPLQLVGLTDEEALLRTLEWLGGA